VGRYQITILSLFFLFACFSSEAQVTIYSEDFNSYADGTTNGTGWAAGPPGKCDGSSDFDFHVVNNAFQIRNVEGDICGCPNGDSGNNNNTITFGPFDISDYCDIAISMDVTPGPGLECHDNGAADPVLCAPIPLNGRDVFHAAVVIDGIAQDMLFYCGNQLIYGTSLTGLDGNSLEIVVTTGAQGIDEQYSFDDVEVLGDPKPDPVTISTDKPTSICIGESITLTAESDGPWAWSNGETTKSITVTPTIPTNYEVTVGSDCTESTANLLVTPFALPIAEAGPNQSICFGSAATLTADIGGSSYEWSDGQVGRTISVFPTANTTYTVTVTSGPGCMDTDDVVVSVKDLPIVVAITEQTVCQGVEVTLTASGATTYEWSNGMTGSSITFVPPSTGLYTVTGTLDGCEDTDQVNVVVNENPTANISGDDEICSGEMTILTASGSGDYEWTDGSTTNSINVSPLSTTIYTLTVTDNGCTDIASFEVRVEDKPDANAGSDRSVCLGERITLTAFGGGDYEWSTGSFSQSTIVEPTTNTTYTVTVTNGNCSDIDNVNVSVIPLPHADIDGDLEICEGSMTTLRAVGNGSYNWSTSESSQSITVSPENTTDYSLTVTEGQCSQTVSKTVVVKPAPNVSAGSDITVCEDGMAILNATGADSYSWSNGQSGSSIEITPSSDLILTVTGTVDGCSSSDDVAVGIQSKITANAGADQIICNGSNAMLFASGGQSYSWSDGSIGEIITVSPETTTTYEVTAIDGVCTATDEVEVFVKEPFLLNSTPDTTICSGATINLKLEAPSGTSFNWSSGETTKEINVNPTTLSTYSVTATDGICAVSKDILVDIDDINLSLSANTSAVCIGDDISINTTSNGTILWPDGSNPDCAHFPA